MFSLVLMLSVFVGSALAGVEYTENTYYGTLAGGATPLDNANDVTFIGAGAGSSNVGYYNTFVGNRAGYRNITGSGNTFIGGNAGYANTGGFYNTFLGYEAGRQNTEGLNNTFSGIQAGTNNTTGSSNTFSGSYAGGSNNTGEANTFSGSEAGVGNTGGGYNSFFGHRAGIYTTVGAYNTFIGQWAGNANTFESGNTLIGHASNIEGRTSDWVTNATAIGAYSYVSQANSLVLGSINGWNGATSSVNVGIGTSAPVRQLHIVGDQAVIRMDRPANTTAFMLVRTDGSGNPLKTFVVGANASASNTGEFVINDLATAVSGGGSRRMTIANDGGVNFPGAVTGASFIPTSSAAFKTNIRTYENALETVKKLRGVRFDWKESGKPSVGLIAEEVDKVIPEVVAHNDKDATGVNYDSLVGVLVEAVKEQDKIIQAQQKVIQDLQEQQKINAALAKKVLELERLLIMSNAVSKAD
jgi:hypothetical protein